MKTLADQGADTGKVRKARKSGECQECGHVISAGESYVVGSQLDYQHGPYAHKRLCEPCGKEYGFLPAILESRPAEEVDALVSGSMTIYQITPLTPAAREWIAENVQAEDYMWLGSTLCVEHRYIADIVQGMVASGLKVK